LVYGKEFVLPAELITPSLYITKATHTTDDELFVQRIADLHELEEARLFADFHQLVGNTR